VSVPAEAVPAEGVPAKTVPAKAVPPEVVTFGETMAAMRSGGPLRLGGTLDLSVAGAESNVAIGLARLGHSVAWAGRVGDDELGALVLRTLRAENVDVSEAVTDPVRPTGLIFFERRTGDITRVQYYRSGSAGSALEPGKPFIMPNAPGFLHLTGITPALSQGAARAVTSAAQRAREAGREVSFDVNFRARLWSAADARAALRPLVPMSDVIFGSAAELALLTSDPAAGVQAAIDELLKRGAQCVVVKRGTDGATAYTADGAASVPAHAVRAVDVIGAGDAFVAGYLSAALDGLDTAGRLRRAATVSAFAVGSAGDWEGLPTRRELSLLDAREGTIR
jgi:2-dehydro-3-deoxygluconokinase